MKTIFAALAFLVLTVSAMSGAAQPAAQKEVSVSIEREHLRDALNDWAQQTGYQLVSEINGDFPAPSVRGTLTPQAALERLLAGTPLTYRWLNDKVVAVREEATAPNTAIVDRQLIRVAQASGEQGQANDNGPEASSESKVEEIVVTAQRREERLKDVPISISVLTGERLDASTGRGLLEELSKVPAVTMFPQPEGRSTVVIRGVAPQAGVSPVGYYSDMVPISFLSLNLVPDADVYDLQRVEVLKGPQGTSYGIGSSTGVVRVLTNDPDPSKVESKARAGVSSTQGGGTNYRADAAVNAPIIDGRLAIRGVVGLENWGGWVDRPNKKDANDGDATNIRLKVGGEVIDGLSTVAGIWHQKRTGGIDAADPNGKRDVLYDESSDAVTDIYSFVLRKDFGAFSLVSSTSYVDLHSGSLKRGIFSAPGAGTAQTNDWTARARAQEINLTSNGAGPWKWTAGAFYRSADERWKFAAAPLATIYTAAYFIDDTYETDSYAAFGELGYSFSQFELLTGLRYTEEKNEAFSTPPSASFSTTPSKASFSKVTPRLVLNWKPSRDVTTYLSYAEGFRSGIIQSQTAFARGFGPVKSDLLHNYEFGNKATLFGGKLAWEAAVYYMDWKDLQQTLAFPVITGGITTFLTATANVSSASGFGGEVSMTFSPVERFQIGGSYSQNNLTFDADVQSGGIILYNKGDRMALSPKSTYGAFADYTAPVGADLEFRFGANMSHFSSQIQRFLFGGVTTVHNEPITTVGLNIGVGRKDGSRRASLFVDNLTDDDAATGNNYAAVTPVVGNRDEGLRQRPRTVGVQVEMKF